MSLYNTIKCKQKCPNCGARIDEWQSKFTEVKGYPIGRGYSVKLKDISLGEMYAPCNQCAFWAEFSIKNGELKELKEKEYFLDVGVMHFDKESNKMQHTPPTPIKRKYRKEVKSHYG